MRTVRARAAIGAERDRLWAKFLDYYNAVSHRARWNGPLARMEMHLDSVGGRNEFRAIFTGFWLALAVTMITAAVDETALLTRDNVEILIGRAEEMQKKDYLARKILAAQRGKVVFIDVRSTDRPVSRGL